MSIVAIVQAIDIPSPEIERAGKMDTLITYLVDGTRQYQLRIRKEEAAPEEVRRRIETEVRERLKLLGGAFEVHL